MKFNASSSLSTGFSVVVETSLLKSMRESLVNIEKKEHARVCAWGVVMHVALGKVCV